MEKIEETSSPQIPLNSSKALEGITQFPLIQALGGRRSRRFCMGAEIPDGPLAFKSSQKPLPLTELEQMLLLTSMAGSTGWHYTISYDLSTRPKLPSFSAGPAGRTFPSAAGLRYLTFSLQMIMGPTTFQHVTSTLHQRIIAESESN
jgi:hypothetical protein